MRRAPFLASLCLNLTALPLMAGAQSGPSFAHADMVGESRVDLGHPVQIVPTTLPEGSSSIETGSDSWAARGYDLRSLIAQIFNVDARRIDFPNSSLAGERLDISVNLPSETDDDGLRRLLADAIEQRFGMRITPESRTMEVYVLTAPNGPGSAMKRHVARMSAAEITGLGDADDASDTDDLSKVTVFGRDCTDKTAENGISVEASTIADFDRSLEPDLDRVLLDETHLTGSFDFTVGKYADQQELFRLLHDQLGLVVTPAERSVAVLAVRPAGSTQSLQATLVTAKDQQN